ncbi:MAG TPA: rhamnulokinase [Planctomycetaceae bacterium]|nr:rhamnulokinase [Planctomycetaceae bacterium]
MQARYLAIDIGASSGRLIGGRLNDGILELDEIHRFKNGTVEKNGCLCWDIVRLFDEIVAGLKICADQNMVPASVGIDTWGVDFVLLDENDKILGDTVAYRDARTNGVDDAVLKLVGEAELYARTGIQKMSFNTIYQLFALKMRSPEILAKAKSFLMIPDYLNYLLTGTKSNEYTNATTTQLVHAKTKTWDTELIDKIGLPSGMFCDLRQSGTILGPLRSELRETVGFNTQVVLPATHDTGSAVLAVPDVDSDSIYVSSGTWSLVGVEQMEPNCSEESRLHNFTNEGGYGYRFRYLKNVMGLWMLQSIRNEAIAEKSFPHIAAMAEKSLDFPSVVDVNDRSFLAPASMVQSIKNYCKRTNVPVPETIGEVLSCAYKSLAACYADVTKEIEELTGREYDRIRIIGGGSQDTLLNRLTAEMTGKEVFARPVEATAIGNILVQMIRNGDVPDLKTARRIVGNSFEINWYSTP